MTDLLAGYIDRRFGDVPSEYRSQLADIIARRGSVPLNVRAAISGGDYSSIGSYNALAPQSNFPSVAAQPTEQVQPQPVRQTLTNGAPRSFDPNVYYSSGNPWTVGVPTPARADENALAAQRRQYAGGAFGLPPVKARTQTSYVPDLSRQAGYRA